MNKQETIPKNSIILNPLRIIFKDYEIVFNKHYDVFLKDEILSKPYLQIDRVFLIKEGGSDMTTIYDLDYNYVGYIIDENMEFLNYYNDQNTIVAEIRNSHKESKIILDLKVFKEPGIVKYKDQFYEIHYREYKDGISIINFITSMETIVFPEELLNKYPVYSFEDGCFMFVNNLKTLHIPNSVISLNKSLMELESLINVYMPDSLEQLSQFMFFESENIEKLIFSETSKLKKIQSHSFATLKKITELNLPDGLEIIESKAFCDMVSLKSIKLPRTLLEVGSNIFNDSNRAINITVERNKNMYLWNEYWNHFRIDYLLDVRLPYKVVE